MRTPSDIAQEQQTALSAFRQARSAPIDVGAGHGAAREARNELERREAVREREQEALASRAAALRDAGWVAERPRAVVLHRAPWTREALCQALERAGTSVVAMHEDGAAGLGAVVAEQPDLVVVQQQLPWRDGLEVVREVRLFAPSARVVVHLDQPGSEAAARDAGAHEVFPRATRPADLVAALVERQLV